MVDGWLDAVFKDLLSQIPDEGPRSLSLDQVGLAVGDAAVTPREIEALFDRLNAEGVAIGMEPAPNLPHLLSTVLRTARELRAEGKRADRAGIAKRSGLSEGTVHVALLYAEVLRG